MNIYQKMHEVMKQVQYLAKDDHVEFKTTKYKAISEEKVTSTMRKSLIDNGLVVFPIKQTRERVGTITSVDVTYRLQNIDDPNDYIEIVSSGDGADTQDKGAGKAMTYAFKYMFLRTFAIPTGEDPDKISSAELDEKQKEEKEKAEKADAMASETKAKAVEVQKLLVELNGGDREAATAMWRTNYAKDKNDIVKMNAAILELKEKLKQVSSLDA